MTPRRPAVRPAPPWHWPQPVTQQLDNGLLIDQYRLPGQRAISLAMIVDAPLTAEPPEVEGVADLSLQACDEGTCTHPGPALTDALEGCGAAVVAAGARLDGATLAVEAPVTRLQQVMPLLAEMIREPAYAPDDVARLVNDRLLGIATGECSPPVVARKAFYSSFGQHRLARPVGGTAETVARITPEAMHTWHDAAVRPNRARLILAGDLPDDTAAWAQAAFGSWGASSIGELPAAVPPPAPPRCRVLLVHRSDAAQASLRAGTLTPTRGHQDWAGLQLANAVVGSMFGSRLNFVLREQHGLTYGAGSVLSPARETAVFVAHAECNPDSVVLAAQLMLEQLDLNAAPITQIEARGAVNFLTRATPMRLDTAAAVASQAAEFALGAVPPDWFDAHMNNVRHTTAEAAQQAFTLHITPSDLVIAICGNATELEPRLIAAGLPPEVIE